MPQHELQEIEQLADSVADGTQALAEALEQARKNMAALLGHAGKPDRCRGRNCRQEIWFIWHFRTGRWTPYNADGTNHYTTCVDREEFHKRRQTNAR